MLLETVTPILMGSTLPDHMIVAVVANMLYSKLSRLPMLEHFVLTVFLRN